MIALAIDVVALSMLFSVAILRLNEKKHSLIRTLMWALIAAGTFGVLCEELIRARVFGPDLWMVMMHVGVTGIAVRHYSDWRERRKHDRGHKPERRFT